MLKSFLAIELKLYRMVFLFFPLLGCVYWYLCFHTPMSSMLRTGGLAGNWVSALMGILMIPGTAFLFCTIGLLRLCSIPVPRSDFLLAVLFVAFQLLFGFLASFCVKCFFPQKGTKPTGEGE